MGKVSYRIQSKILNSFGNSEFVKFGTSENIEYTIKWHKFHLTHRTHPDPQLRDYVSRKGLDSLEFIVDVPIVKAEPLIEKAIVEPVKETRAKKKSG